MPFFPLNVWFVIGGVVLGYAVLRFALGINEGWLKDEEKMNSPMSITLKTGETPAEVHAKAQRAKRRRLLAYLGVLGAIYVVVYWRNPQLARELVDITIELAIRIAELAVNLLNIIIEELGNFLESRSGEQVMSSSILILHATVGTGHKTAALALEKAFKQRGADRVWVQDTLDYGSGLFRRLYANLYIDLSEKTPELWGFAYHESNREQSRFERQLRQLYSRVGVYKVDELNHLRPDAILCTHFLPIDAALNSLAPAGLKAPVYCVVTDFVGHPFWAHPGIKGTFVGNEMTGDMLVSHGVPRANLHVTGIPVNPNIAEPKNVAAIREQRILGRGHVVTLIGSGIDDDKVRQMVEGILQREVDGVLCVVAGRNYTLQKNLVGLHGNARLEVRVLGFIDYLDDLIAASDLVITKSGGLITSEVMARGTPLLVTEPIRGQEEFNADYVVTAGVGVQARLTDSVPYMVESLLADAPRLARMRQHAALYGRPKAAFDIADIVLNTID